MGQYMYILDVPEAYFPTIFDIVVVVFTGLLFLLLLVLWNLEEFARRKKHQPSSINLNSKPTPKVESAFEELVGIDEVVELLKNEVVLPLCHPEYSSKCGFEVAPVSGIILHGPPGCGKTTLARAVAKEAGVPLYQISASEITSGLFDEPERNLLNIFKKASLNAPSVLLIDDDIICSRRITHTHKDNIVSQLRSCMDNLYHNRNYGDTNNTNTPKKPQFVVVIATTDSLTSIDPTLGRKFSEIITMGILDENARQMIFAKLTRKLKVDVPLDLAKLAECTPNFVGKDLVGVVETAKRIALKRVFDRKKSEILNQMDSVDSNKIWRKLKQSWAPQELQNLQEFNITMADFKEALIWLLPFSKIDGFSSTPNPVESDDIVGGLSSTVEFNVHSSLDTQFEVVASVQPSVRTDVFTSIPYPVEAYEVEGLRPKDEEFDFEVVEYIKDPEIHEAYW